MAWNLPDLIANATDRTVAWANKFKACFDVLSAHTHTGADGQGAILTSQYYATPYVTIMLKSSGGFQDTQSGFSIVGSGKYNAGTNLGDDGEWEVYLVEGVYSLRFFVVKGTNGGIADIYWNGVVVGQVDAYAGSTTVSTETISDLTASSGINLFKIVVSGKNGSSSDYLFMLNYVSLLFLEDV